jgi:hypothetical protein
LGNDPLRPSDKLLKICRGVASAVPLTLEKIEVNLDFHVFDILYFDILLDYPLENFLMHLKGA